MPGHVTTPVRTLGVLTGGGDVPGLNVAIQSLVARAEVMGIHVLGLRAGWEGITYLDRARGEEAAIFDERRPDSWQGAYLMPLTRLNTLGIDRAGGTILQSTRTNPANVRVRDLPSHLSSYARGKQPDERVDLTAEVLANIEFLGLDGLVVIGGDDTLSYGAHLARQGVPVWGIPKTMDNDVPGTEYCIGFQTAISRGSEFINRIRSTIGSHRETGIFRIFGRDAGFTALELALVTRADRLVIPEVPVNIDHLSELVREDRHNPHNYSLILMSEGANLGTPVPTVGEADAYGHKKKANIAEFLADELTKRMSDVRFLPIDLTYLLRSGEADAYDKHVATYYAHLIMGLVEDGISNVMAAYQKGACVYTDIPAKDLSARRVDPQQYHPEQYRPYFEHICGNYCPQYQ